MSNTSNMRCIDGLQKKRAVMYSDIDTGYRVNTTIMFIVKGTFLLFFSHFPHLCFTFPSDRTHDSVICRTKLYLRWARILK